MCDYSLMNVPNRLAREREELVTYWFPTGSLGLASPCDVQRIATANRPARRGIWQRLREFRNPPKAERVAAVCIPPGAQLRLADISDELQKELSIGAVEEVTFTQITAAADTYRDAVRFQNGKVIRLQDLRLGQRVTVLDLALAEELDLEELPEESTRPLHRV